MNRIELIKLFKGIRKGTRPLIDLYTDWPTKSFIRYFACPDHFETMFGEPVSPKKVAHVKATYPKIKFYTLYDTVAEVEARLWRHHNKGRRIFVPLPEVKIKQKDTEMDENWTTQTTYTDNRPDDFVNEEGTRLVKEYRNDGKNVYKGFSKKYLFAHPNAYEEFIEAQKVLADGGKKAAGIIPVRETRTGEAETGLNHPEPQAGHPSPSERHGRAGFLKEGNGAVDGVVPEIVAQVVEVKKAINYIPGYKLPNYEGITDPKRIALMRKVQAEHVIPDYMYPLRDPKKWAIIKHPHRVGVFFYQEIPQEPPPRRYCMV